MHGNLKLNRPDWSPLAQRAKGPSHWGTTEEALRRAWDDYTRGKKLASLIQRFPLMARQKDLLAEWACLGLQPRQSFNNQNWASINRKLHNDLCKLHGMDPAPLAYAAFKYLLETGTDLATWSKERNIPLHHGDWIQHLENKYQQDK